MIRACAARPLRRGAERACVFAGTSLAGHPPPPGVDIFPPATRGALTAAVRAGYTRIGFVDGALEQNERLPLRELREALATPRLAVIGGASMGAVRAVQLESAGMQGVGRVFRLFRRGSLADSDEVYVLHAPAALRYRSLTLPLVNIRYTLRAMRPAGCLSDAEERLLVTCMQHVPWFDRDRHSLSAVVYASFGSVRSAGIMQAFDLMYRDVKREDARSLISRLHPRQTTIERNRDIAPVGIRSRALRCA